RQPEDYVPKKLEEYVREGGGLAVFLGPNVDPKRYNQTLYRDGQGLFPVQLPDKPTDIPTPDQFIKRQEQRANELTKWVLTRDPAAKTHPALAGLYTNERGLAIKDNEIEKFFPFIRIDRYWPVARLGEWTRDPSVRELYCMANERPIASYQKPATDLVRKIEKEVGKPKFQRYRPVMTDARNDQPSVLRRIEMVVAGYDPITNKQEEVHVARLARYLDELLRDQIAYGDEHEPLLRAFWAETDPDLRAGARRCGARGRWGPPFSRGRGWGRGGGAALLAAAGAAGTAGPWGLGGGWGVGVRAEM